MLFNFSEALYTNLLMRLAMGNYILCYLCNHYFTE